MIGANKMKPVPKPRQRNNLTVSPQQQLTQDSRSNYISSPTDQKSSSYVNTSSLHSGDEKVISSPYSTVRPTSPPGGYSKMQSMNKQEQKPPVLPIKSLSKKDEKLSPIKSSMNGEQKPVIPVNPNTQLSNNFDKESNKISQTFQASNIPDYSRNVHESMHFNGDQVVDKEKSSVLPHSNVSHVDSNVVSKNTFTTNYVDMSGKNVSQQQAPIPFPRKILHNKSPSSVPSAKNMNVNLSQDSFPSSNNFKVHLSQDELYQSLYSSMPYESINKPITQANVVNHATNTNNTITSGIGHMESLIYKLQQHIQNQHPMQVKRQVVIDILKIDAPFNKKYQFLNIKSYLKENQKLVEEKKLPGILSTLEQYASNLLIPQDKRHKSWRNINMFSSVFQDVKIFSCGMEILKDIGYAEIAGNFLTYSVDKQPLKSRQVLEIATDLCIAKFEVEQIILGEHSNIMSLMNDPTLPKYLFQFVTKNKIKQTTFIPNPDSYLENADVSKIYVKHVNKADNFTTNHTVPIINKTIPTQNIPQENDESMINKTASITMLWKCATCTFDNKPTEKVCEVCKSEYTSTAIQLNSQKMGVSQTELLASSIEGMKLTDAKKIEEKSRLQQQEFIYLKQQEAERVARAIERQKEETLALQQQREIENARRKSKNEDKIKSETLMELLKNAERNGYKVEETMFATKFVTSMNEARIIFWLQRDFETIVKSFKENCDRCNAAKFGFISIEEARDILLQVNGNHDRGFMKFIEKRKSQLKEFEEDIKDYKETFKEANIFNALNQSKGNISDARNSLTMQRILKKHPNFIRDLQKRPTKEEYIERLEKFKDKEIPELERLQMIMGEKNVKFGRAQICLKLIEEEDCSIYDTMLLIVDSCDNEQLKGRLNIECKMCYLNYSIFNFVSLTHCQCSICFECYADFLKATLENKHIRDLHCPSCEKPKILNGLPNYFEHIEQQIIHMIKKKVLNPEIQDIFLTKLRDFSLESEPNFRWCAHCQEGFLWENGNILKMYCVNCYNATCFGCKEKWDDDHEGLSCEQYKQWKIDNDDNLQNAAVNNILNNASLKCPKCKLEFQLARGGCLHFICTSCKHQFCSGCAKTFYKKEEKCEEFEECHGKGFHAHHPRNCYAYLRDNDIKELRTLLDLGKVEYPKEVPDNRKDEAVITCNVMLFNQVTNQDEPCGKDVLEDSAGLCELHYKEHLSIMIYENRIDPIAICTIDQITVLYTREHINIPGQLTDENDATYLERLREITPTEIPLHNQENAIPLLIP